MNTAASSSPLAVSRPQPADIITVESHCHRLRQSARSATSSAHCQIFEEAVRQRSIEAPRLGGLGNPSSGSAWTSLPLFSGQASSPLGDDIPTEPVRHGTTYGQQPPPPRPLFPPTTAIVGDSIITNIRYFNCIKH
ncbi:uncharacterized protein V6R79_012261 [Siganus canaliculatus]